jgi:hypothetical protein
MRWLLCGISVLRDEQSFKYIQRRDAEYAEDAQRIARGVYR